jgi:hypothetical protein
MPEMCGIQPDDTDRVEIPKGTERAPCHPKATQEGIVSQQGFVSPWRAVHPPREGFSQAGANGIAEYLAAILDSPVDSLD